MTATKNVSASAVSRALSTTGLVVSPGARRFRYEGIYVERTVLGGAAVFIDYVGSNHRQICAEQITEVLEGKGYDCRVSMDNDVVYVERPA